jgi:hypothetical protein
MGTIGITDKFGSAGTFFENINKNRNNILGGVSNTQENSSDFNKQKSLNEILGNVTSTKVFCKDGTIKFQQSSPNAMYGDACADNGGRAEKEVNNLVAIAPTSESVKQQNLLVGGNTLTAEDKFYESLGIKKSSGGWGIQSRPMGRILVAIVLVAGYFAYKKFKK